MMLFAFQTFSRTRERTLCGTYTQDVRTEPVLIFGDVCYRTLLVAYLLQTFIVIVVISLNSFTIAVEPARLGEIWGGLCLNRSYERFEHFFRKRVDLYCEYNFVGLLRIIRGRSKRPRILQKPSIYRVDLHRGCPSILSYYIHS